MGYVSNTSRRGKEGLIVSGRNGWQKRKVGGAPVIDVAAGKLVEAWKEHVVFEEAQAVWEHWQRQMWPRCQLKFQL